MAGLSEQYLKDLDFALRAVVEKLREELRAIRGNRPSVDLVQDLKVNVYDQILTIKQLGSLSVIPPRAIQIGVWDKSSVGPVVKAIEDAKIGLSVSNDGNIIHARLSELSEERREELSKTVRKSAEETRIHIRRERDGAMKSLKSAEETGELPKDRAFKLKEKIQKAVEAANGEVEAVVQKKFVELGN